MDLHIRTPYKRSQILSVKSNLEVYIKLENTQPSGSFKIRGIGRLCSKAASNDCQKFVSSSGGNAGLAAAYAARKLRKNITIYTPESTAPFTVKRLQNEGATVIVHGRDWDDCNKQALAEAKNPGHVYISPFDHPDIWEGHSTMITEIHEDVKNGKCPKPDVVICSVGGGGLFCGVVQGLKKHNWDDIPIVTVETEGASSFYKSVQKGERITLPTITSIAKSLGAKCVGETTFEYSKIHPIVPVVISDKEAVEGVLNFLDDERILVEPACSVCLSIIYNGKLQNLITTGILPNSTKNVAVIICGGSGVKLETLLKWKSEFEL